MVDVSLRGLIEIASDITGISLEISDVFAEDELAVMWDLYDTITPA